MGRSLLGDNQYRELMASLKPGEYAFVVLGDGEYSFKGSGYVRGGIFDRVQLRQFGDIISFRDLDYQRLSDVYAEGMPEFREMAIFVARASQRFDPGSPWTLELLVRRQTGPVAGVFTSFELACQTPEEYLERPQPTAEELAALEEAARPLWLRVWYQKSFQIGVLCTALVLLLAILFLQDRLVRRPRLMQRLRTGYLAFTLVYLGWYSLGQLSVVNVLTFVHALFEGFRWELFLSDPLLFILWTFTAASLLLWGRGVFCGWLCPFGALQELLNELARKLRVPQFQVPFAVHERLWAIKYIILLVLFGLSWNPWRWPSRPRRWSRSRPPSPSASTASGGSSPTPSRCWWSTCSPARSIAATSARWARPWRSRPRRACSTGSSAVRNAAGPASSVPANARSRRSIRTAASRPTNATTASTAR